MARAADAVNAYAGTFGSLAQQKVTSARLADERQRKAIEGLFSGVKESMDVFKAAQTEQDEKALSDAFVAGLQTGDPMTGIQAVQPRTTEGSKTKMNFALKAMEVKRQSILEEHTRNEESRAVARFEQDKKLFPYREEAAKTSAEAGKIQLDLSRSQLTEHVADAPVREAERKSRLATYSFAESTRAAAENLFWAQNREALADIKDDEIKRTRMREMEWMEAETARLDLLNPNVESVEAVVKGYRDHFSARPDGMLYYSNLLNAARKIDLDKQERAIQELRAVAGISADIIRTNSHRVPTMARDMVREAQRKVSKAMWAKRIQATGQGPLDPDQPFTAADLQSPIDVMEYQNAVLEEVAKMKPAAGVQVPGKSLMAPFIAEIANTTIQEYARAEAAEVLGKEVSQTLRVRGQMQEQNRPMAPSAMKKERDALIESRLQALNVFSLDDLSPEDRNKILQDVEAELRQYMQQRGPGGPPPTNGPTQMPDDNTFLNADFG
jgi:hypothetical protein